MNWFLLFPLPLVLSPTAGERSGFPIPIRSANCGRQECLPYKISLDNIRKNLRLSLVFLPTIKYIHQNGNTQAVGGNTSSGE
jgi:hypothetical protein